MMTSKQREVVLHLLSGGEVRIVGRFASMLGKPDPQHVDIANTQIHPRTLEALLHKGIVEIRGESRRVVVLKEQA